MNERVIGSVAVLYTSNNQLDTFPANCAMDEARSVKVKCTEGEIIPIAQEKCKISSVKSRNDGIASGRKSYLFPKPRINKPALQNPVPYLLISRLT